MSDLENEAKPTLIPLIQGTTCQLDKAAQRMVALWTFKTAMMLDFIEQPQAILPAHRHGLYDRRKPPPTAHGWIGTYEAKEAASTHAIKPLEITPAGFPSTGRTNAYGVTMSVGHLVVQLFGAERPDYSIRLRGTLAQRLRHFHPYRQDFVWPSAPALSLAEVRILPDAWRNPMP